jgi:hypothetical protein
MIRLDHIAVAGTTLEDAAAAVEVALGVRLHPGGTHDLFGTHNRLLGLADGLYVEAIAQDPDAAAPAIPRWFDLDRFSGPARLSNWICATDCLSDALEHLPEAGRAVALRRGDLRWQMAVPDDGRLSFDNLYPALICWQSPVHPSALLPASGCSLRRLVVSHPEAKALQDLVASVLQDERVVFDPGPAGLIAEIQTPHGMRTLA